MSDAAHGEVLFKGLLDYPLLPAPKTRDYVFFIARDPKYGASARKFFTRFYGAHAAHDASSIEELIGTLHADVTQHGVQRIREIVIVSHGTPMGLILPVLISATDANLNVLTAYSMALLQKQMKSGALNSFKEKRDAVVAHLDNESWVTVRACRFGQNDAAMYGLYSFFGGRANVYAPKKYQFFGDQRIVPGSRYPDRLAVHEHLVRQRFEPKDQHTPDRQDAIVRALADPGGFSAPFVLETEILGGGELPAYGAVLDSLNARQISAPVRASFHTAGFDLTSAARVRVQDADTAWIISDSLAHPDGPFAVQYDIGEVIDTGAGRRSITVQASLPAMISAAEHVPLQLFLSDDDDDEFNLRVLKLAWSRDDEPGGESNVRFDAVRGLLESNGTGGQTFSAGQIDLRKDFEDAGIELAPAATLGRTSPATNDPLAQTIWRVGPDTSGVSYEIRLRHHDDQISDPQATRGVSGTMSHTLNVHQSLGKVAKAYAQDAVVAHIGIDLDCPGVELAASMDRLSRDELIDLITFLRAPYRPEQVVHLYHALQAVARKSDFRQWYLSRFPIGADIPFPTSDPLTELSLGEREDKNASVYDFEFWGNWAEVKASTSSPFAFQHDLFVDESLAQRFGIPETELGHRDPLSLIEDSPGPNADEIRELERLGFGQYLAVTHKQDFAVPVSQSVPCADFRAVVLDVKGLVNTPVEQLVSELAGKKTPGGKSYLDIVLDIRSKYSFLTNMLTLTEMADFLHLPDIPDPTSAWDVAKVVAKVASRFTKSEVVGFLAKAGEWDAVITIPIGMWLDIIMMQQEGVEKAEAAGKITGARAWLRGLRDFTFDHESDFPDDVQIDVTTSVDPPMEYWLAARWRDLDEAEGVSGMRPIRFTTNSEPLKKGFDEGAASMARRWPAILRYVEQVMADVLRESGLAACQVQALIDAGLLDRSRLKAGIVRAFADRLLSELPHG